jgi:hypothetical protein
VSVSACDSLPGGIWLDSRTHNSRDVVPKRGSAAPVSCNLLIVSSSSSSNRRK